MKSTFNLLSSGVLKAASAASILALGHSAYAGGSDTWFIPLTESAPVTNPNSPEELAAPWVTPAGIMQKNIVSLREIEDQVLSPGQSIIRVPGLASNASMIDMMAFDDSGEYLFLPHETLVGAGVTRYDFTMDEAHVLFQGDMNGAQGDWSNDWGAFDPSRWTPNGTLWLAEEWSGEGRVIEVLNPLAAPEDIEIRELHSIANVSHEGINFSEKFLRPIYYIDENNSGSVYRFMRTNPKDYTKGQTFVLVVDDFAGDASRNWNDAANAGQPRTGLGRWVPITDWYGNTLPGITNPFEVTEGDNRPGRTAADDIGGTPYGRPEDMEVSRLRNNNEVIYFTATSEASVYSVEMIGGNRVKVGVLVDGNTPKNLGFPGTTGVLNSPDNLAQDALGNIYVIEDAPNGSSTGGDIWFVRDRDNDGVAESLDHFMSIRADGCEATGMIFNPVNPTQFVVAVQHPDSTNLSNVQDGLGDSVWSFDISYVDNQRFVNELKRKLK
ncbi:DUF839 domain-containing protein [Pelagicoccus sp. NFK12]|uniref:DUF839 domain-containing protein n=1 Tax=Pelagicoccus enzymogenes TaxID=2773457 RepID=A0A927F3X9_9BACT|nr:alkaline phosphatase PhoX [Pelagicoccus enzymogenes]MBD5777953.1 DUF839 domain-containing protein [Pelagicoccus enzymogenes]